MRRALPTPKVARPSSVFLFFEIRLVCQFGNEFKTWLNLINRLGLEDPAAIAFAQTESPILDLTKTVLHPSGLPTRSGGDITKVSDVVEADVASWLFVLVGYLEWQVGRTCPRLPVDPELALADLHLLDRVHVHACVVFHELENGLVREVLDAEDSECKCNAGADITGTEPGRMEFPDCLHLAGGSDNTNLVKAEGAGCFL